MADDQPFWEQSPPVDFWEQDAVVQPQPAYTFDEIMQPPAKRYYTTDELTDPRVQPESAVGTFGREAVHAAGPLAAGAAAFPAGFAAGEALFPAGGGLPWPIAG
jgi:hypothetical protein